jgi:hypothetical protein
MSTERPRWLPEVVWLGREASRTGSYPIEVFQSETEARLWAADQPDSIGAKIGRRIWAARIPATQATYRVTHVPATTAMVEEER